MTPLPDIRERKPLTLDDIDIKILEALQDDGRLAWSQLAEVVGLSPPATTERVRRLEREGYIRRFRAELDPVLLGRGTLAFVAVKIQDSVQHDRFVEIARSLPEILECHVVAGEYDYLLKVRTRSPEALAELLREGIRNIVGVTTTNSIMVLQTLSEENRIPLPS